MNPVSAAAALFIALLTINASIRELPYAAGGGPGRHGGSQRLRRAGVVSAPVILSEDDLAAIMAVACANPCRDAQQQTALLDAAAHLDAAVVDYTVWASESWEWMPCPACGDHPVPRSAGGVCRSCRRARAL